MHIDNWLELPAKDDEEVLLKAWFQAMRLPAVLKNGGYHDQPYRHPSGITWGTWANQKTVTCTYKGKKMRCVGASRLGDVWLTSKPTGGYETRVDFDDCSDWKVEQPVEAS